MIRMVPRYGTIRTVRDVACILKGILFFFVVFDSTGINTIPTLIRPDAVFRSFAYFCDGRACCRRGNQGQFGSSPQTCSNFQRRNSREDYPNKHQAS